MLALSATGPERRRLLELGIVPGARITPELDNPFGDPRAFRVMGGLIALRRRQAEQIAVKLIQQETSV